MKSFPIAMIAASLLLGSSLVHAAEPANPHVPLQKTIGQPLHQAPVPTLGVINSDSAMLEGSKLTLTGVAGNVIVFADRPVRAAGHETVELFISRWAEGKDSFAVDPPNATVSVLGGEKDGVADAVVVLKNPKLVDGSLTFEVDVLEGDLKGVKGPAAVFIDHMGGGGHGGGGHGGGHYHGGDHYHADVSYHDDVHNTWHNNYVGWGGSYGWYGAPAAASVAAGVAAGAVAGAAVGAAEAAAPITDTCGYYPYPPCN